MGFFHLGLLLFSSYLFVVASGSTRNLPIIAFEEGYTHLFGDNNLVIHRDGKSVHLTLDERTGFLSSYGVCLFVWIFLGKLLIFILSVILFLQVPDLCLMTFIFTGISVLRLSYLLIILLELWLPFM